VPGSLTERVKEGQLLIAGIRPEHFEDATLVDDGERKRGVTFRADIDVTEWLGNELYAYIPFEAPQEVTDRLKSLARELDSEALRTQLVASLNASSRITDGEQAELWFDPNRLHLFDPASGENLTRDLVAEPA
jgi:multiple sugar transport system ATP-binding protein